MFLTEKILQFVDHVVPCPKINNRNNRFGHQILMRSLVRCWQGWLGG